MKNSLSYQILASSIHKRSIHLLFTQKHQLGHEMINCMDGSYCRSDVQDSFGHIIQEMWDTDWEPVDKNFGKQNWKQNYI